MNDDLAKFLDELRSRVSIVDVIGSKVKLTKRGHEYLGLCPFHHEKTPSFTINESKGFYHCFGCGAHGDIVKFEMESNGLPFIEAVKKLAGMCGLTVPTLSKESHEYLQKRKSFYEIMDIAVTFFEKNLYMPIGNKAYAYLRDKRGLTDEIIKKFRLGYAPNNNGLKALLASKGVSERDMADLGLIATPENRPSHDFFRDRMMVPIFDKVGNVIAFGGRILDDGQPKYLNSPETPIFNKRRILFNLNRAKDSAYSAKKLILCEGYMDVIALDSFGFNYAVAPLGTALTEEQILEAWKVCNIPTLCFDGDGAGINAAIRSIERVLPILKAGYSVNYIFLKEKKDPDELLRSFGAEKFNEYLQKAKPLVDILWHKCKMNKEITTPEQKALLEKETIEEVNKIRDLKIRNYYMQEMKNRMYYTFNPNKTYKKSETKVTTNKKNEHYKSQEVAHNFIKKPPLTNLVIRNLVATILLYPELINKYAERLSSFEIEKSTISKILNEIIEIYNEEEKLTSGDLIEKIKLNYAKEIADLWELNMYKSQKTSLLNLREEMDNCLLEIQLKQIDADISSCMTGINNCTDEEKNEMYEKYQQLIKERNELILKQ